jgi:hypothetical protein
MAGKNDALDGILLAVRRYMDKHGASAAQALMVWQAGLQAVERRKRRAERARAFKEKAIMRRLRLKGSTSC